MRRLLVNGFSAVLLSCAVVQYGCASVRTWLGAFVTVGVDPVNFSSIFFPAT